MTSLYVQFSDASETSLVSLFCCAQDKTEYPNQGVIDSGDTRYKTFFDKQPASMQKGLPTPS